VGEGLPGGGEGVPVPVGPVVLDAKVGHSGGEVLQERRVELG
jgi:hypothetical protein